MFFDAHVHFDDFAADGSLTAVLERAESSKVWKLLAVGGSPEANELSLKLAGEFPHRIFGSVGYDRGLAGEANDFALLREQAGRPETVAIGETGLDYFYEPEKPETVAIGETGLDYFYEPEKAKEQKELFFQCLETAAEVQKPVIVHTRDADDDTLGMLTDFSKVWKGDPSRIGVLHCFTRGEAFAKALLDLGFHISFSGIVTFLNADPLREVAKYIPEDRLLIETDSPYLAPMPHRGKRCEPAFVVDTAKRLADLRGIPVESLAKATTENAMHLFGL